ncbi:MAG TPA: ATP-binding cassette domain-containing protein, partial [Candidatus Sumerlaeota bacterium]|nr:ATP-binding cassette domain-containing protein [Candidatus Sumerlaeota bacterium]
MVGLNKYYGPKQVLKDIYLSFYPGAKIGIVGENGSGKSTVLKIMAGQDDQFQGKADLVRGYTRGLVPQEPRLEEDKTVIENLRNAFTDTMKLLNEYDEITMKMGEDLSDKDMEKATNRMAELQDKLVITIMGACAQELYDLGHCENFFYLQHAMGLASSIGLGVALNAPNEKVVVMDGDGSVLMNLGTLTTLARYKPNNLTHI